MTRAILVFVFCLLSVECFGASPNHTAVPPSKQIVDNSGNVWTVVNGKTLRNGIADTASDRTLYLLYQGGRVLRNSCQLYVLNTDKWPAGDVGWVPVATNLGMMIGCPPDLYKSTLERLRHPRNP